MKNNQKILIVLEGVDGTGKTTLLKKLKEKLIKANIETTITKEPSNSLGEFKIRDILLNSKHSLTPMMELLLFLIDRNIHIEKKIKIWKEKLSNRNEVVLCDRSFYSTFVYQGKIGGIPLDDVFKLHELSNSFIWPNLTFFINVESCEDYEIIEKRKSSQNDRMEAKTKKRYKEISNFYNEIKKYFKKKKPNLKIKTIKWMPESEKMVKIIFDEIILKLNEN